MEKIAVLGGGNGGCAFSGYLGMKGFNVCLYEVPQFKDNIEAIKNRGGIDVVGVVEGFGKIGLVTSDIEEAIEGAEVIMISVPAFAHRNMATLSAPYLKEGQIVVLNPGSTFGVLEFATALIEAGNEKNITIAETTSNIFGCRKVGPDKVKIMAIKNKMPVAASPMDQTEYVVGKLKKMFDEFEAASSVLETGLNNGNCVVHPAPAILNAGWIEASQGNFDFYWKGMSPSVCKVMEAVDKERIEIGKALDFEPITFLQSMHDFYGKIGETLHDFLSQSTVHGGENVGTKATPPNLNHRYITEDIPYGLVPYSELAKALGVPTPFMDSLILLASEMNDTDYRKEGRNLEKMGIKGKRVEEIKAEILR